jgi:Ca2+/Na+ antiporter
MGELYWRYFYIDLDYLSITAFAKRGNASTAIAGIFSGPLFNFLLGFGISCTMQSLDGEYNFVIFDLSGDNFAKISDSIVVSVIVMAIVYMVWIFFRVLRSRYHSWYLEEN